MALGVGVAAGLWGTDQPGLEASVDRLVNASYSRPMVGAQERRLSATMSQDLIFFFFLLKASLLFPFGPMHG